MLQVDAGFDLILTDTNKIRIEVGLEGFDVPMDFEPSEAREIADDLLLKTLETESKGGDSAAAPAKEIDPNSTLEKFINDVIGKKVKARMQISSTDWNKVGMTFYLNDFVLPLEYPPDTALDIARKLLATARLADAG